MIEVIKSDFKIFSDDIKPALKEILKEHPDIKQNIMFISRIKHSEAEQLQIALYILGLHTRVNPEGYVFGLKTIMPEPLIKNNCLKILTILSQYTNPEGYVTIKTESQEKEIKFDNLKQNENPDQTLDLPVKEISQAVRGPGRPKRKK
jgi:hypothetical protein